MTAEGITKGLPRIESDIDACEVVLMLAPETNGEVAVKAWEALSVITGREHKHLALPKEDEKIRFRDIQAQPRKIISSPTWSGIESEHVSYNAGYTNVHELIPWRTLTGRQQFYQDHKWMLAFGEGLCAYRPPVDLKTVRPMQDQRGNGNPEIVLNFITPHQKWGIHSTYTDNLIMLTLSRGGPIVWLSETDAKRAGIEDNDWIELFNVNGAITARAVVSQRVSLGMCLMYHAQEKIVNVPGSEITGAPRRHPQLGHAHRHQADAHDRRLRAAVVRLQLLRHDRHQPRRVRRRAQDEERRLARHAGRRSRSPPNEDTRADRHGAEPRQVHRLPHVLRHLQERVDQSRRRRVRVVQQRRDQARHRLPEGVGEPGQVERRLGEEGQREDRSRARAASGRS